MFNVLFSYFSLRKAQCSLNFCHMGAWCSMVSFPCFCIKRILGQGLPVTWKRTFSFVFSALPRSYHSDEHQWCVSLSPQEVVTNELEDGDRQKAMKRLRVPPLGAAQVRDEGCGAELLLQLVKVPNQILHLKETVEIIDVNLHGARPHNLL